MHTKYGGNSEDPIKQNEIWIMDWYPTTPIGHFTIAASSLESLLLFSQEFKN